MVDGYNVANNMAKEVGKMRIKFCLKSLFNFDIKKRRCEMNRRHLAFVKILN